MVMSKSFQSFPRVFIGMYYVSKIILPFSYVEQIRSVHMVSNKQTTNACKRENNLTFEISVLL